MRDDEIQELAAEWLTQLRNDGKSANTCATYQGALGAYLKWRQDQRPTDRLPSVFDLLSRGDVEAFGAAILDGGGARETVALRIAALRSLSRYLAAEGELDGDPLAGLRAPAGRRKLVPKLADGELERLVRACQGKTFLDRRDEAITRLMAECGVRADELLAMSLADVDLGSQTAAVRRAKGGRQRRVAFGGRTSLALSKYIRARRGHRLAGSPRLWLGAGNRSLGYDGLYRALRRRADAAGIEGFHPHRLRHSFASAWLKAGGSETGLRRVAGWADPGMIARYTEDAADELALGEARRLGLGDSI